MNKFAQGLLIGSLCLMSHAIACSVTIVNKIPGSSINFDGSGIACRGSCDHWIPGESVTMSTINEEANEFVITSVVSGSVSGIFDVTVQDAQLSCSPVAISTKQCAIAEDTACKFVLTPAAPNAYELTISHALGSGNGTCNATNFGGNCL